MILDVTQPLLDYDGSPSHSFKVDKEGNEIEGTRKPLFLRTMLFQALDANSPTMTPEEKMMSFRLLTSVMVDDKVKLTTEEATYIKKQSGLYNPPLPHGRICEAIEAAGNPSDELDND